MQIMSNKFTFILCAVVSFLLGSLTTYILVTKQQMDALLSSQAVMVTENKNQDQRTDESSNGLHWLDNNTDVNANDTHTSFNNQDSKTPSIYDYSPQQAQQIINDMPNYLLEQYVDKFMAKDASALIIDKRRFAQRAIEELYSKNDNQRLVGDIRLSLSEAIPSDSVDTTSLPKYAKLFAHLNTNANIPHSAHVFVKWIDNQTGQVLLFEKKDILADTQYNWVSFIPNDGWHAGSYDIRFYQFTSELQPIAQLTYHVHTVYESNASDTPLQDRYVRIS